MGVRFPSGGQQTMKTLVFRPCSDRPLCFHPVQVQQFIFREVTQLHKLTYLQSITQIVLLTTFGRSDVLEVAV